MGISGRVDNSAWGYLESLVIMDTERGEPLGAASLVTNDMAWRNSNHGLTPWMSSVFVQKKARRKGLGSRLVDEVAREAARRGFTQLFLYVCPEQEKLNKWYERRGFETWGEKRRGGFRVMRR